MTYSYTYDGNGNILSISDGTHTTSYVYDSANQLIRENNQAGGFTHTWEYDPAGNILNRKEYAYTTGALGTPTDTVTYSYDDYTWGDLLTGYDGQEIVLDEMGNPDDDGVWGYYWLQGRELYEIVSEDEDGRSLAWSFTYDANGMRTERSDYNEDFPCYYYVYNGSSLSQMKVDNNTLYFAYGANGVPMSVTYNNVTYYYVVNIQGDIIAILNSAGTPVVHYSYDAWGNHLSISGSMASTLGVHNPLRYRGYVYDQETGLYYLQSRYYNPEWGRFLNADAYVSTGQGLLGNNMFAYCLNNPVNFSDPTGEVALGVLLGKAAIGAAVNVLTTYIGAKVTGQHYSWRDAGVAALAGALGTGNTTLKIAAGVVSGLYTGVTAYQNGADVEKAVLAGAVSAWGTTVSVANIAGWTGPALELGVSTFTDVVFGTASNSIAAATYRASIETSTSNNTKQQVGTQCANNLNRTKLYCDKRLR